ncbi:hypothetical protein LguiA_018394 [Lonicera macranthoides]
MDLSSLQVLDLSYVDLSLATSHWLQVVKMLVSLLELQLADTNLHTIPLFLPHLNFTYFLFLDLSYNDFSSQPPQWLFNISSIVELILYGCHFNGPISSIAGGSSFCNIHQLDQSVNEFIGGINELVERSLSRCGPKFPNWLQTQTHLETIVLRNIGISETIPNWLWKMSPHIHLLDVSHNQIRGTIPRSYACEVFNDISKHLNLSHNNLSSPIPSGNQFLTFDESIYEGNQGLYGSPLPIKCEAPTVEKYGAHQGLDEENSEDKYENFRLFVSIALGFIVGFWTLCGSLVIKKSRRDSYFGFLKNVKAWIVMVVSVIVKRLQRMIAKDGN